MSVDGLVVEIFSREALFLDFTHCYSCLAQGISVISLYIEESSKVVPTIRNYETGFQGVDHLLVDPLCHSGFLSPKLMSTHLDNFNDIHVFGGGLLGLYVSSGLSQKINSIDQKLFLYDQSNTLLSSWDSKVINTVRCNNGFHGIEHPRADLIVKCLDQLGCKNHTFEFDNYRILCIQGREIGFTDSLNDWPQELANGLEEILAKKENLDLPAPDLANIILRTTKVGSIINKVYTRFADQIMDCWHLICPWFFPKEFLFPGNDEGSIFQNNVREKLISPKYLIPKSNIFSDLRPIIFDSLQRKLVRIYFENKIDLDIVTHCSSHGGNLAIWCASSFGLLLGIDPQLAKKCIVGSRHMHLLLFSLEASSYDSWVSSFSKIPTEILYLNVNVPELNRVSFPQQVALNTGYRPKKIFILAECFTRALAPDKKLPTSIQDSLSTQFSSQVKFEGLSYGRPMFNFSSACYPTAEQVVQNFANNNNLIIPSIYFGPINMAKCGIIGNNFLQSL